MRGLRIAASLAVFVACSSGDTLARGGESPEGGSRSLEVGGGRIRFEECGAGPAIVLLHDGLLRSVVWDGEWTGLCRAFHVIRYNRRGYGLSDPPRGRLLARRGSHRLARPDEDYGRLTFKIATERDLPLFPSSESKFFMIIRGETEIDFVKDANGKVTGLELRQDGRVERAERISSEP